MTLITLAQFCYRRRRLVLAAWILATVALVFTGFSYGAPYTNDFGSSDTSARFFDAHFPHTSNDAMTLAIHSNRPVDDPAVRARVETALAELARVPHVVSVVSPYRTPGQISPDGHTAFATAQTDTNGNAMPVDRVKQAIDEVRNASGNGVTMALGGAPADVAESPPGGASEGFGLLFAALVLLIAFGSLLAMGLPLVTAIFGVAAGLAVLQLLGHLLPAPGFAPILAAMVAIGVGVDYAMFVVTRYRDALNRGAEPEQAVVGAMVTAGRAVLFAGTTVVVAMLGLLLMGQPLLNGVAVGAAAAVAVTMLAAVTLLPALLGFAGHAIDRFRLPWYGRAHAGNHRPLADRWARLVQRRPLVFALAATAVLVTLAAPLLGLRLSMPDDSVQPHTTSAYQSHAILADGFGPGHDAPLIVGVTPASRIDALAARIRAFPDVASVTPPRVSADGVAAEVVAFPRTSLQDQATQDLADRLRALPGAYVGGPSAGTTAFADLVRQKLPMLIAVVVGVSVLLLVFVFRSVVLALKAAVMNMLSVAAAYGVLVAVVQWGWGHQLIGLATPQPIAAYVPMMMFPILFGLSMDYEVFLISSIREEHDAGRPTSEAVGRGLARTARVITAAAAIMVMVFMSFVLGADAAVKQLGLGLAVAVLVDATIVRLVLVPALMELLGAANWWLPRWTVNWARSPRTNLSRRSSG